MTKKKTIVKKEATQSKKDYEKISKRMADGEPAIVHCCECHYSTEEHEGLKEGMLRCEKKEKEVEYGGHCNTDCLFDKKKHDKIKEMEKVGIEKEHFEPIREEVMEIMLSQEKESSKRPKTTELIARAILKKQHLRTLKSIRADDKTEEIYMYVDGIQEPFGKIYIKKVCRYCFGTGYTSHLFNVVLGKIIADTYVDSEDFFKIEDPYRLAVGNGILDLKTGKLDPFDADEKHFIKINYDYKPNAKCPKIEKFFSDVLKEEDDIKTIQELFGVCLVKKYFKKAGMFYGKKGDEGKSTITELGKTFFGSKATKSISLQDLTGEKFMRSVFLNCMVNFSPDLGTEAIKDTGIFKALTGGDSITADRKFLPPVTYVSFAQHFFSANVLPPIWNPDEAFWNRWAIFDCPIQFKKKKDFERMKKNDEERR